MTRHLGDRLVDALLAGGVAAAFGVPGGQTLPLYSAAKRAGLRHVLMRDERAAACAADAYARVSGRIGVCDATVGPGVTNLVSGLAEAYASSVPVLAVVADVPTGHEHLRRRGVASQAFEQRALLEPVSKWIGRVDRAEVFDEVLDQALRVATTGRPGPVVLEIPDDVFQQAPGDPKRSFDPDSTAYPRFRSAPSAAALDAAVALIAAAKRPLIFAGGGASLAGAGAEITRLAETTGMPVTTTLNGKGSIDERHPLAVGVSGVFGSVRAGRVMLAADLVLVLGSKLDQLSTHSWRLPGGNQRIIHIDVDAEEIGRTLPVHSGIVADAREAAAQLADRLKDRALAIEVGFHEGFSEAGQPGTAAGDPGIAPEHVVQLLSERLGATDVLLCDASLASGWGAQHFKVKQAGRGFVAPRGLAGIGWGCGAAVGASLAMGDAGKLVCLAGDGAWAYSLSEVETAVRNRLPITYVILNNSTLGWIRHIEQARGDDPESSFGDVDFAAVATAMGARGERVGDIAELPAALDRALAAGVPWVVDIRTSADASPIVGIKRLAEGMPAALRNSSYDA